MRQRERDRAKNKSASELVVAAASEELTRHGSAADHPMVCPATSAIYKCDRESELMTCHQHQRRSSMRVAYPSWVSSSTSDGLPRVVIFNVHEVTPNVWL